MQCEQIQSELIDYFHGTLSPQQRAAIEAHLTQCEACAEEANAMNDIGEKLSQGLKEWVNQGVCPPEVAARIELSVRRAGRRPPWRRAFVATASVAAAAAVLGLALSSQLIEPDLEIHLDPQQRLTAALFRPSRSVKLQVTESGGGLSLTITSVATGESATRIDYTVQGEGLVLPEDETALVPEVATEAGPVSCPSLTADQRRGGIRFALYCEPVPAGETIRLTLPELPRQSGGTFPPLTATFTN